MLKKYSKGKLLILVTVVVLIVLRLVLIAAIPLLDKTESRYGEIARLMLETKEWIVLQIDYGVPFWAKPPISTWLSALSMSAFGVNEFAARFPSFLLNILLILILGKYFAKDKKESLLLAFILLTIPEFYLHTGVVSTDTAFCFSATLVMLAFWKSMQSNRKTFWNYLFFIAIALGFLSKGPLTLVLTGPPILIWIIINKIKLKTVFKKLPWISGILITALISVPWYYLTEKRSPGFLDYYLIGEHFKRFLVSGWKGDLYGSGHAQPLGFIWLFLLLFSFPWIQIVLIKVFKTRKTVFKDSWVSFLLLWLLWTPFFFTFSKNILHTYTLPVTIPIALLMIHWWEGYKSKKIALGLALIFPALVLIASVVLMFNSSLLKDLNTDKYLLAQTNKELPHFYWKDDTYSSHFYNKGKIKILHDETQLDSVLSKHDKFYLLISNKNKKELPKEYLSQETLIVSSKKTSIYLFE